MNRHYNNYNINYLSYHNKSMSSNYYIFTYYQKEMKSRSNHYNINYYFLYL